MVCLGGYLQSPMKYMNDFYFVTKLISRNRLGDIMKFKEYDVVRIMIDCEEGVKKGEIGTILMVFEEPQEAYEVEIPDKDGKPKAQCALLPEDLEPVTSTMNMMQ